MKPLVVITGASSGIGAATAKRFSKNGYPLLLLARRKEKLDALNLPNTICQMVDVNKEDEIRTAVKAAEKEYGKVDCLVNNAGVMYLGHPWDQDPCEWQAMIQTNILGVLNCIHAVLKDMMDRKTGTIINIGSIAGKKTFGLHSVYCGTKFAVHAISETIRMEVAHSNVRVITIGPGPVETELITHSTSEEFQQTWWDGIDGKDGILQSDDVAQSIQFVYEQAQRICIRELMITPTSMKN